MNLLPAAVLPGTEAGVIHSAIADSDYQISVALPSTTTRSPTSAPAVYLRPRWQLVLRAGCRHGARNEYSYGGVRSATLCVDSASDTPWRVSVDHPARGDAPPNARLSR